MGKSKTTITLLFAYTHLLSASQLPVVSRKKHICAGERSSLSKLFSGSLFNDTTLEQQKEKLLAQKKNDFIELFTKNPQLVHQRNSAGDTPLLQMSKGIHLEIFGANQEDISEEHLPAPVAWASLLIQMGADVNAQNTEGKSALHYAVESLNEPLITALFQASPDTRFKDARGKQAIDYFWTEEGDDQERAEEKQRLLKLFEELQEKQYQAAKAALLAETNIPTRMTSLISDYVMTSPRKEKKQAKKNDHE